MKEIKLKNGSKLVYECGIAFCYLRQFEINGIDAYVDDFGEQKDISPETAEPYCCGNMQFIKRDCREKVLNRYGITKEEYEQICKELDCLSFGCCGWCQ